jgi:hypothetical protein
LPAVWAALLENRAPVPIWGPKYGADLVYVTNLQRICNNLRWKANLGQGAQHGVRICPRRHMHLARGDIHANGLRYWRKRCLNRGFAVTATDVRNVQYHQIHPFPHPSAKFSAPSSAWVKQALTGAQNGRLLAQ